MPKRLLQALFQMNYFVAKTLQKNRPRLLKLEGSGMSNFNRRGNEALKGVFFVSFVLLSSGCVDGSRSQDQAYYQNCIDVPPGMVRDMNKYSPLPDCWVFAARPPKPKALSASGGGNFGSGSPGGGSLGGGSPKGGQLGGGGSTSQAVQAGAGGASAAHAGPSGSQAVHAGGGTASAAQTDSVRSQAVNAGSGGASAAQTDAATGMAQTVSAGPNGATAGGLSVSASGLR